MSSELELEKQRKNIFINFKNSIRKSEAYDTYWKFAYERQNVFFKRYANEKQPWTEDKIIQTYKFTNAYRASDRVSQYLIKDVIYNGHYSEEDTIFRILLFKIFNKIETWKELERRIGRIEYSSFTLDKYDKVFLELLENKFTLYSGAYIMASGKSSFGYERKYKNHLALLEFMFKDGIVYKILKCKSLQELFCLLQSYPTLGKFLAFQYAIDINYSEVCNFSEMEFVVPGPGALSGIKKCFTSIGRFTESDIIKFMSINQEEEFERLNLPFKDLWGRKLQLIDCQNLFCETDKYCREKHPNIKGIGERNRIKQKFSKKYEPIEFFYPPKWKINDRINSLAKTDI